MSIFKDLGFKKRNGKLVSPDVLLFDGKTYDEVVYGIKEDIILSGMVEDSDGLITTSISNLPATITQDVDESNWNAYKVEVSSFIGASQYTYVQMRADDGTNIIEDSKMAVSTNGATVDNTIFKYGSGSYYFPGGGKAIKIEESNRFGIGAGDFTIECWYYPTAKVGDYPRIIQFGPSWGYSSTLTIEDRHGGDTGYSVNIVSTNGVLKSTSATVQNQWTHIALTRQSGVMKLFINGVMEASTTYTNSINDGVKSYVHLGSASLGSTSECIKGYIDNFRFAKEALYTENFTPADISDNYFKKYVYINGKKQTNLTTNITFDHLYSLPITNLNTTVNVSPTNLNSPNMDIEFDIIMNGTNDYSTLLSMRGTSIDTIWRLEARNGVLSFGESIGGWTHTYYNHTFVMGQKYHFYAKFRGTSLEYFIDGLSVGESQITRDYSNSSSNMDIGHYYNSDLWSGSISNIQIKDNVLETEIFEVEPCDTNILEISAIGSYGDVKIHTWVNN